jgi:hypothetical protein
MGEGIGEERWMGIGVGGFEGGRPFAERWKWVGVRGKLETGEMVVGIDEERRCVFSEVLRGDGWRGMGFGM